MVGWALPSSPVIRSTPWSSTHTHTTPMRFHSSDLMLVVMGALGVIALLFGWLHWRVGWEVTPDECVSLIQDLRTLLACLVILATFVMAGVTVQMGREGRRRKRETSLPETL